MASPGTDPEFNPYAVAVTAIRAEGARWSGTRGLSLGGPALGLGIWSALLAARWATGGFHEFLLAETLFLLAPLVLVPLALPLTSVPARSGRPFRLSALLGALLPPGALALVPAFALELPWQARAAFPSPVALPTMLRFHGTLNALGFVGLGVLGAHGAAL